MKKLNYFFLLIPFLFLSCSKDSTTSETPATYSILGAWKTKSSVLNGVEIFGDTNEIKSEWYYFNPDGSLSVQSYTDANFGNLFSYSTGTYTIPNISTINVSVNQYLSSGTLYYTNNLSCEVQLINATQLHVKILNYPSANDVYIKKFIR